MKIEQFDDLTQHLSGTGASRRQALQALAGALLGGTLGGLAARVGLVEVGEAQAKKHKAKPNQKRTSQAERMAQGQLQAEGKRKKKRKKKPNPCGPNLKSCLDGSCIAPTNCCPGKKSCPGEGCIPDNECCELTAPLCGACEEELCNNGAWVCRPSTGVASCQTCPADSTFCASGLNRPPFDWFDLPEGCCPLDRYFPDQWWGTGKYFCAQPEGPGSVWLQCD